jgi:GAF domain-containing protein
MDARRKKERYRRIITQLEGLLKKTEDSDARMATVAALLHHKMEDFFWTGFYCLNKGELLVRSYQGPLACQVLEQNKGVCWAGINGKMTIIVPDVHKFPGHIACDTRSRSEIVVPVYDKKGKITGVLDVDSSLLNTFDETDAEYLEKIVEMIYSN